MVPKGAKVSGEESFSPSLPSERFARNILAFEGERSSPLNCSGLNGLALRADREFIDLLFDILKASPQQVANPAHRQTQLDRLDKPFNLQVGPMRKMIVQPVHKIEDIERSLIDCRSIGKFRIPYKEIALELDLNNGNVKKMTWKSAVGVDLLAALRKANVAQSRPPKN